MKRRSFLGWIGVGALASSLPMAIAACSDSSQSASSDNVSTAKTTETAQTVASADGFESVGTVQELDEQGFLIERVLDSKAIVIRNPESPETLIALSALCTHSACTVDWEGEASEFSCPCHGSKFAPDGNATNGPATEPLSKYEVKIEGEEVKVKVV